MISNIILYTFMRLAWEELALGFIAFCINDVYFNNDFKTIILILKMIYGFSSYITIMVRVLLSALKHFQLKILSFISHDSAFNGVFHRA